MHKQRGNSMLSGNRIALPFSNTDLFFSAKAEIAIPARYPLVRDALAAVSLDPDVESITFVSSVSIAARSVKLDAIVLTRSDGRYYLDIGPARPPRSLGQAALVSQVIAELGLHTLVITQDEILKEPRFANARLVWTYAGRPVPIGLRMQILQMLSDDGPLPLGHLLASVRSHVDPAPGVMALACANLIELDLISGPLGPAPLARSRV